MNLRACVSIAMLAAGCAGKSAYRGGPTLGMAAPPAMTEAASGAFGGAAGGPAPAAIAEPAEPAPAEAIVVEGDLGIEVEDAAKAAAALRAEVEGQGGRIVDERLVGGAAAWRAEVRVRIGPEKVAGLLAWMHGAGNVVDKRLTATDVSRTLFDRDLAIANKRAAMVRLEAILERGGATMADVLAIEQEMTRLRGEVEALEGEQRFLRDRVQWATLTVTMVRRDGEVRVARAALYPGVRLAALSLLDPGDRKRTRFGVGLVAHTILRHYSMEVDLFTAEPSGPGDATRSRAVIATVGGAGYSDFLGRGKRRFGNPYVGIRAGYGYLDASHFVVQGEVGLELFKHKHGLVDVGTRITGLIGKDSDLALVTGVGAALAF